MDVEELAAELPFALREQILTYSVYAEDAAEEVFVSLGEPLPGPQLLDDFVLLAGIWRLWQVVDGQHSLITNALGFLENTETYGFQLGRAVYSPRSERVEMLNELRTSFAAALRDAGIGRLSQLRSLQDVAVFALENQSGR